MTALEDVPLEGWCPPAKRDYLTGWIAGHDSRLIVEIGVYGGASFIPMALQAMKNEGSRCIGIDPWNVRDCLQGMKNPWDRFWWRSRSNLNSVEKGCREAVKALELTNVELWKGTSDSYIGSFQDEEIDVLSIDGNHGPQAVLDAVNYLPKTKPGALIAMDDEDWADDGIFYVREAIEFLVTHGCKILTEIDHCVMLQKAPSPGQPVVPG